MRGALLVLAVVAAASDYYASIDPSSSSFVRDLHNLLYNHEVLSYSQVWEAFDVLDEDDFGSCNSAANMETHGGQRYLRDVYSSKCWAPGSMQDGGEQCGNYHRQGDCYNREHGWPKSWFGGFKAGHHAQTDLFLLFPADGYVNALRGSLPLGNVAEATYTSSNGCRIGRCANHGGTCFEVADEYKGDFARSYFYISITYMDKFDCCDTDGVDRHSIKDWMEAELRHWHKQDPVSDYERHFNELIYSKFQGNRSPFIDHPEWVDLISDF